jgi:MoaA/NifB/PqqE/SkfB family radical SAM enzyme
VIQEEVLQLAEGLADLQRGPDVLDAEGKSISWDQEHGDEFMANLTGPLQIPWMYSRKCNFFCKHCYNFSAPAYDEEKDADPFLMADRIIEAQPYTTCLCGGEPLAWEHFYAIVERLRAGGIPLVSIVTNGYLATPDVLAKARDSGLTTIQFSIDGVNAEQHGRLRREPDSFDRAVAGLREALTHEWQDLSISLTPTKYNIADCRAYISKFADMGVRHVRFQPYMPLGRGALNAGQLQPSDDEYLRFHFDLQDAQLEYPDVFVDWGDPLEHLWFYAFTEANCWSTGISTDGWLEISPYIPLLVGDLNQHSIREVWAKGIKAIWHSPLAKRLSERVYCTDALKEQEIAVYRQPSLYIDVFDDEQWEALMNTDDLDVFKRFSERNRQERAKWHEG